MWRALFSALQCSDQPALWVWEAGLPLILFQLFDFWLWIFRYSCIIRQQPIDLIDSAWWRHCIGAHRKLEYLWQHCSALRELGYSRHPSTLLWEQSVSRRLPLRETDISSKVSQAFQETTSKEKHFSSTSHLSAFSLIGKNSVRGGVWLKAGNGSSPRDVGSCRWAVSYLCSIQGERMLLLSDFTSLHVNKLFLLSSCFPFNSKFSWQV